MMSETTQIILGALAGILAAPANYFLSLPLSLSTALARSYLTASRCARPMRIVRRITSCLAMSSLDAAFESVCSSSSVIQTDWRINSFSFSFIVNPVVKSSTFSDFKKLVKNTTLLLTS